MTSPPGFELHLGDCLEVMNRLPAASVDLILCDLPYGTTRCKWDTVIPFAPLWAAYRRLAKPNAPIVLTCSQPFTSSLLLSNPKQFRHEWIWEKTAATGFLNAKRAPLRAHENVLVFCKGAPLYVPQKTQGHVRKTASRKSSNTPIYGPDVSSAYDSTERYPRSVQRFASDKQRLALHPTQKPVALMEYLVRTYSLPGARVLDNCVGSGTTGAACAGVGDRYFIGIENDPEHFRTAESRVAAAYAV